MKTLQTFEKECLIQILLLLSASAIYAQTDSAFGFFPLHTGDIRQYRSSNSGYCADTTTHSYDIERVTGDTILPTGFNYRIVRNPSQYPDVIYLRVDSLTANVYRYEDYPPPHDELFDSLRATPGSTFVGNYGALTECLAVDTATVLGVHTVVKRFRLYAVPYSEYELAYGFGRVQYLYLDDDPCYPLYDYHFRDLIYAMIDSEQHGRLVSVGTLDDKLPIAFSLSQNYPNPFNAMTVIRYTLPGREHVLLKVYDVLGRELANLVDRDEIPGKYSVKFNGSGLASGVYFYRLSTEHHFESRKLVLLR